MPAVLPPLELPEPLEELPDEELLLDELPEELPEELLPEELEELPELLEPPLLLELEPPARETV